MKVAIDIRRINDFGVGTYIRNIVRSLGRAGPSDTFYLIGSAERFREIPDLPPNVELLPHETSDESPRDWWEFRALVRHTDCDVVHIPHLFGHPILLPCPYVVTVHDLLNYFDPAAFGSHENGSALGRMVRRYFTQRA